MTTMAIVHLLLVAQAAGVGAKAEAPSAVGPELTLDDAFRAAAARNLDLKVAQARMAQAHELHRKAWSYYLPNVGLQAGYTRNSHEAEVQLPSGFYIRNIGTPSKNGPTYDPSRPPSSVNPPGVPSTDIVVPYGVKDIVLQKENQLGAQVSLQQALVAPALWPAIRASYLAEQVAELNVENARREVLFGVAQVYYGAASLKEIVEVQRRLLDANLAHERDAEARVAAGALPRIGLVRARIDRVKSEQDLRRAGNGYASAKIALGTLLDRDADFEVVPPARSQPPVGTTSADDGDHRPDLRAARVGVRLAETARRGVYYKYAPNVFLSAAYRLANVKGFVDSYDSWSVMVGLGWTLWDGGLREAEAREAGAKVVEAEAALRSLELHAREEIRRATLDLESARANRTKSEEQVRLARENMQLVNDNYQAGLATQLDATDASTALASAELGLVAEGLNAELAELRLLKAAGAFDPIR
jgi:outer membrane protein, multidrug efflux system